MWTDLRRERLVGARPGSRRACSTPEDWQAGWIEPGRTRPARRASGRPRCCGSSSTSTGRSSAARLHATAHGIVRGVPQRRAGRRRRADPRVHPVRRAAAGADLRRHRVAASGPQRARRRCWPTAGSAGRSASPAPPTSGAAGSALLAQLQLTHADGSVTVLGTGPRLAQRAPATSLAADLIAGERWDLRPAAARLDRSRASTTRRGTPSRSVEHGYAGLVDSPAPPVRRVEELTPVSVTRLDARPAGGRPRPEHQRLAAADATSARPAPPITLTHGEWLDADGDVTTEHLRPAVPFLPRAAAGRPGRRGRSPPACPARSSSRGTPPTASSTCAIEGHPDDLTPDDVTGVVVHTDLRRTGWFSLQRRADQPAARGRGLELPGQRLRHPDRLPAPGAGRLDRRLAAVRADRRVPLRRRRLLDQVAARPRRRPVAGRHRRQHQPGRPRRGPGEPDRASSTARPAGATPP